MDFGDKIQRAMGFHWISEIGNHLLLLLWYAVHFVVSIWYFASGLGQKLESHLISSGLLKKYKALDPSRVRYLAIVVESEEAHHTFEVIELLQRLARIGVKNVCLYDREGVLKKSKELIMEKLSHAKLAEQFTLDFASFSDGKEAVAKAANYLFTKNYFGGDQKEIPCTESHINEALKAVGYELPDPDLLLIYGPTRCHLGFPAWRIQYTEMVHMGPLKSMKYGSLIKAIYRFTMVKQNYGT